MVIIRENKTASVGIYYTFTEIHSGMQRTWTPPKSINPSLLDDLLLMLGTQLEENVHSGVYEPFEQVEIDPETFCQIPFHEMTFRQFSEMVFIPKKVSTLSV